MGKNDDDDEDDRGGGTGRGGIESNIIIPGTCDICTKPDGILEKLNLQKCRECGVCVHEVCYGMIDTGNSKDTDFVCHACAAVGVEVEVNVPSVVGGPTLRDILGVGGGGDGDGGGCVGGGGMSSFREFVSSRRNGTGDKDAEGKIDFYFASIDYSRNSREEEEEDDNTARVKSSMKSSAHRIYDAFIAKDAPRRITDLSSSTVDAIERKIFDDDRPLSRKLFDEARREVISSLERRLFERYKKSSHYPSYLSTRRKIVRQDDRPTKCVLCSVSSGIHAMHPLYDMPGKEGRQLLLPGKTCPIKLDPQLAWVHTLCGMFLSANKDHGGLVFGCKENGEYEFVDSDDDDDDEDDDDEDDDLDRRLLEEEQDRFTRCEEVFKPLMDELETLKTMARDSCDAKLAHVNDVLSRIESMIKNVNLLTPPFIENYDIGKLLRAIRETFEASDLRVKEYRKRLSKEMKRVYKEKKDKVPNGFVPVKSVLNFARSLDHSNEEIEGSIRIPADPLPPSAGKSQGPTQGDGSSLRRPSLPNGKGDLSSVGNGLGGKGDAETCTNTRDTDTNVSNDTTNDMQEGGNGLDDANGVEAVQKYKLGTTFSKRFKTGIYVGRVVSYDATRRLYRVVYPDSDFEDLDEGEISELLLSCTAWFCMEPCRIVNGEETKESKRIRELRDLPACVVCNHQDKHSLRIPVQCTAGDKHEYKEFKQYHKKMIKDRALNKKFVGCARTIHIGCARWGKRTKSNNKHPRMCYFFSGKPPTYIGNSDYTDPVANCFCREHALEIQDGMSKVGKGHQNLTFDEIYGEESDDSAKEARRIAKLKKRKRIQTESDEDSE
ncbi:hypothetical protein ACHAXA_010128 [Cyclostephanos tholiformis]|uniref:RGS domain-containing protein n=1 Tax=Cyclostephanos tholiformis TaxID=382380 RepID=A0ABD3RXS4_9STRA